MKLYPSLKALKVSNHKKVLKKIIIVGPYPTVDFVKYINSEFKPEELHLVVDDGWVLGKYPKNVKIYPVKAIENQGLVHQKLYLLEYCSVDYPDNFYWRLGFGSANASIQAFSKHAECFSVCRLNGIDDNARDEILEYFDDLVCKRVAGFRVIKLSQDIKIFLPEVHPAEMDKSSSFDSWLRKGILCHKYQHEPSFGKLIAIIKNHRELPKGAENELLERIGLTNETSRGALRKQYIMSNAEIDSLDECSDDSEDENPLWRGQYFMETNLGFWTSNACYKSNKELWKSKKAKNREYILGEVLDYGEQYINERKGSHWERMATEFSDAINRYYDYLSGIDGVAVSRHFVIKNNKLDKVNYKTKAIDKLNKDFLDAKNTIFSERYISGYEFIDVPQLGASCERFALSFCESLIRKMKKHTRSKLAQKLMEYDGLFNAETGEEILHQLRDNWDSISEDVELYFREI